MSKFASIKVGELVTLVVPLTIKETKAPYPLSGVTAVTFIFRKKGATATVVEKTGAVSGDASLGIVAYALVANDWTEAPALSIGSWDVIVEVQKGSGIKRFGPGEGTMLLKIGSDLR